MDSYSRVYGDGGCIYLYIIVHQVGVYIMHVYDVGVYSTCGHDGGVFMGINSDTEQQRSPCMGSFVPVSTLAFAWVDRATNHIVIGTIL